MLKSKRKFGVEIEFVAPTGQALRNIMARHNVVGDGSLRPLQHAGEYVSSVLSGASGEIEIQNVCATLKSNRVNIENPKVSVHVHIDGKKNDIGLTVSKSRDKLTGRVVAVSNRVKNIVSEQTIIDILRGSPYFGTEFMVGRLDNTIYLSKGRVTRHPKMNYTYYSYDSEARFKWLRNIFYFYTQYDEVMNSIVSKSRRVRNMYCIPLSDSFDLSEIEECKTIDDIIDVWYKGNGVGGHYDDSRYHNVNLHSYFDRHGTVEIRSHGGTIDLNKILLWVRLHQHIADKLENMELDDIKASGDIFVSFIKFIEDDPLLVEYVKRLFGYFSGITISGNKSVKK